jgi:hypothetical protein
MKNYNDDKLKMKTIHNPGPSKDMSRISKRSKSVDCMGAYLTAVVHAFETLVGRKRIKPGYTLNR